MFERRVWAGAAREATSFAILLQVVDKSVRVDRVMSLILAKVVSYGLDPR